MSETQVIDTTIEQYVTIVEVLTKSTIVLEKIKNLMGIRAQNVKVFEETIREVIKESPSDFKQSFEDMDLLTMFDHNKQYPSYSDFRLFIVGSLGENESRIIESNITHNTDELIDYIESKRNEIEIELQKLELQKIETSDGNPFAKIHFGDENEIKELYSKDTKDIVKRISSIMVEILKQGAAKKKQGRKGDLNWRKTMKSAMQNDGIPYELKYHSKSVNIQKDKPVIYLVIDISGSCLSYIPVVVTMGYALMEALPDYEIVIYSSPEMYDIGKLRHHNERLSILKTMNTVISDWEKKDLQGNISNHIPNVRGLNRISNKSMKNYVKTPQVLFNTLRQDRAAYADYVIPLTLMLTDSAPDNSVFILFTDNDGRHNTDLIEMKKSESKFCRKLKKFEDKIFFVNPSELFKNEFIAHASKLGYSTLTFPCNKFDISYKNFYPVHSRGENPNTYAEWLEDLLNMIKKSLI